MPNDYGSGDPDERAIAKSEAVGGLPKGTHLVEYALMGISISAGGMPRAKAFRQAGRLACVGALALSGCAQPPAHHAWSHGKEYFPTAVYGAASPRMVADGQPVPKGGGQYLVGHPYRIAGKTYYPTENPNYSAVGLASWYGDAFHGRRTANGEVYDMHSLTAAHPTMPLPSYARVTNLSNGYSVIVRVNDRGPYHGGRVTDVSSRVADVLDFKGSGTARVRVDYVGPAPMEGSDDGTLLASLRTDGGAAHLDGYAGTTMVAEAEPPPAVFSLFSSSSSSRASAPPPPPPAAAAEPAAAQPSETSDVAVAETPRPRLVHPPVPPERPFDLGAAKRDPLMQLASAPLPPHRLTQADRALYFAESERHRADPIGKSLKHAKAKPLVEADDN
jgi:rare lipoprotein A